MLEGVRGIKAWEYAHRLVLEVYRATERFPRHEVYGLTPQLRRAAVSVPANIAEGCQRQHLKEYAQFLYMAFVDRSRVLYLSCERFRLHQGRRVCEFVQST